MSEGRRSNVTPSELRDAIELARRGRSLTAEVAEEALRWLQGLGEAPVPLDEASARLGRPAEQVRALIELARVLPDGASPDAIAETLRLRTSAAAAVLASDLLASEAARPTPAADMPTALVGTPEAGAAPTVGAARPAPRAHVPPRLGPYQLGAELGHGGMGIVFRAQHVKLGSDCAVKVLIAGEHASPESIERFQREAAAVAKMGKHPNIVTVHDLGQEGALSYYAMELVEGESLRKRLAERPYAPKDAAALVEKVARALHFAHEHGVVHRDMKPENIVVRSDGEPQVMDFGLARDLGSSARLSVTGQVMGTPAYMAPEQVRGDVAATDARTDVYALGAVLYELLTGIPPHGGQDLGAIFSRVLAGDIVPPRKLRADVPRDLETVSLKCLELSPQKRYATAEALADDLARFQRGEPVHARPVGRLARFARRVRRHPLVSSLIAASVVFALGMGWKFLGPARVEYATEPADARVEAVGATLWGGGRVWPARSFKLRVTRDGYLPREVEVPATPGATIRLETVKLDSAYGTLRLETEPNGAEVFIDGVSLGVTNGFAEFKVAVGSHRLLVRVELYEAHERLITVESGKVALVGRIALLREHGTLELTGTPREMSVVVWDIAAKREVTRLSPPATLDLETGSYELRARLKDHFAKDVQIELCKRSTVRENISLAPQLLWACPTMGEVYSSGALGDLNGDGCLDCAVGSGQEVCAFSGRDGAVLWRYVTRGGVTSTPALGDVNGDGVLDCVVGSHDKTVYALSGRDGAVYWSYETGGGITTSPVLGDVDGDGVQDCVVGSSSLYVLSGRTGALLWMHETNLPTMSSPSLGDVNGDAVLDCVVKIGVDFCALSGRDGALLWSRASRNLAAPRAALADLNGDECLDCVVELGDKKVCALSGREGSSLWAYETGDDRSSPALGDLDGDKVVDCVVGSQGKYVVALSGRDGALLWRHEVGGGGLSSAALGDMDGDGSLDCVVNTGDQLCTLSARDGSLQWTWETMEKTRSFPTLGDVNGDGVLDCVVSGTSKVYALSGCDVPLLWAYQTGDIVESSAALGDINGDGAPDCIVGSNDNKVHVLSGRNGAELWSYRTLGAIMSTPALGNVDGDGTLDCVVGSQDNYVYALSGRDGALLWRHETEGGGCAFPTLGDVDGDGCLDCVVNAGGRLWALSGRDGSVLWSCVTGILGVSRFISHALRDVNGDGRADCILSLANKRVCALSGRDGGVLWSREMDDLFLSVHELGDTNGDGNLDCVTTSPFGKFSALSGRDGAVLWNQELDMAAPLPPALGDVNGDGVLDCVIGWPGKRVSALSGRDGSVLWSRETPATVSFSPALAMLDSDSVLDYVVVAGDRRVLALSGMDGAVLWAYETVRLVTSSPALGDLNGDGRLDCVVGSNDGRVCAIAGRDPTALRASARQRLGFYRRGRWWPSLCELATERLAEEKDPWARAVTLVHLGLARLQLGDPKAAIDAFAEARKLQLRAPDGAMFEWLAAWRWAECPAGRREEARMVLLGALAFQPDTVFDAFVEVRDLLTPEAIADLRVVLDKAPADEATQTARAMLLAAVAREGTSADLFTAAERRVLARLQAAEGNAARWHGYLALLADAQGDRERFQRTYAVYLDQPRRPESLDQLLAEIAARK